MIRPSGFQESFVDKNMLKNLNFMELYDYELEGEHKKDLETNNVVIEALEFEWAFRGKTAKNFIQDLALTNKYHIFDIYALKVVILFLWNSFQRRIYIKIFVPYLIYFIVNIFYVTYIF